MSCLSSLNHTPSVVIKNFDGNPISLKKYQPYAGVRIGIIILVVTAIFAALAATGQLSYTSQWIGQNIWFPITGGTLTTILIGGAAFVICRARKNLATGDVFGSNHWMTCVTVLKEKSDTENAYSAVVQCMDLSNLDAHGSGVVRLYMKSHSHDITSSIASTFLTPAYTAFVLGYNIMRLCVIPFYIAIQMLRESEKALYPDQRPFSLSDIPKQMALSCGRILQAPFYGLAFFFASLYAVVDPMNGFKLGAAIEYDWNAQLPLRNSGFWLAARRGYEKWRWEGGGGPDRLGENGFYFAGSWQTTSEIILENWHIQSIRQGVGSSENTFMLFFPSSGSDTDQFL